MRCGLEEAREREEEKEGETRVAKKRERPPCGGAALWEGGGGAGNVAAESAESQTCMRSWPAGFGAAFAPFDFVV